MSACPEMETQCPFARSQPANEISGPSQRSVIPPAVGIVAWSNSLTSWQIIEVDGPLNWVAPWQHPRFLEAAVIAAASSRQVASARADRTPSGPASALRLPQHRLNLQSPLFQSNSPTKGFIAQSPMVMLEFPLEDDTNHHSTLAI